MGDWGPVVIAVVLFVLLTPGLLCQIPGRSRAVEFRNMQTSCAAIVVHTIIYFALITILLLAVGVHIYVGERVGRNNYITGQEKIKRNTIQVSLWVRRCSTPNSLVLSL